MRRDARCKMRHAFTQGAVHVRPLTLGSLILTSSAYRSTLLVDTRIVHDSISNNCLFSGHMCASKA
jgi:hypothetical protein